jgi:hypothetical protein
MRSVGTMLLLPAALLMLSPLASASSRRDQERLAKMACLAGDPQKGVEILAELYVDTNEIMYLFNQGRCFEQNSRYEAAIGRFREYLLKGESRLSAEDKEIAQMHIARCQSYLPDSVAAAPYGQPQGGQVATKPPAGTVVLRPPATNAGLGLRIAGIAVGGLGAAALASGVILNVKANSMASDLGKPGNFDREKDSTRQDYKTLGWIGYGVGAACLAGGSVLYFLGWRSGRSARPRVALVPNLAPGTAGALLTGSF